MLSVMLRITKEDAFALLDMLEMQKYYVVSINRVTYLNSEY